MEVSTGTIEHCETVYYVAYRPLSTVPSEIDRMDSA